MSKNGKQNRQQIINALLFYPRRRVELFLSLPLQERRSILLRLSNHVRHDLAEKLPDSELVATLEQLDPDEATDIIQLLPEPRRKNIVQYLSAELKKSVELLSPFDPETAAGLMNIDYIQVEEHETIGKVGEQFRIHERRTGRLPTILVMRNGKFLGHVPGHVLAFAQTTDTVKHYVKKIHTVHDTMKQSEVLHVFREHPHNKIVVLGERGNIMGIIYSDDIIRLLEDQASASLYDFAGVRDEESVFDTTATKVRYRYKWLIINLATAFLASFTVGLFDQTIAQYVLLAVYMPIVAGMGGNAATQTLAVLVRAIALRQIDLKTAWLTLKREVGASIVNGIINGIVVAIVVIIVNRDVRIAIVLALAMVINLIVAAIFGTLVPLVMKKLGKDPAASATVFITTATDVLGFLAFLGIATIILGM